MSASFVPEASRVAQRPESRDSPEKPRITPIWNGATQLISKADRVLARDREQKFLACLRAHPGVEDKFVRLLKRGVDRKSALLLLIAVTLPPKTRSQGRVRLPSPLQAFAEEVIPSRKKAIALAKRLRRSAKEL